MRKTMIGALALGVLLVLGGFRAADLWRSRAESLAAAESRAANLALILSEYLAEVFASGDAALRQLALHNRRVGGPSADDSEWAPSLASARAGLTGIGSISISDVAGIVRHSTRREIIGLSRADNYITREAARTDADNLIVGTPVRAVIEPFGVLLPIARRITAADGTLQGAVIAVLIPAELRKFFQNVDVGARGTVWVFHPDGTVLFREPSASAAIGESASGNPLFLAAVQRGAGVWQGPTRPDGPMNVSAFHTNQSTRVIVAVSLDRAEALTDWTREAIASGTVFAVATTLLTVTLLVLFRQIDAKASAEAALQRAREVEAERLRDANERLVSTLAREQAARKDAEAASALKDQFLMTVSHELRTPLTAIAGWARLLVDGMVADDRKNAALRTIERNAQAQTRLIEDLLDVSGIMSGKLQLHIKHVSVADVVQSAVEAVRPAAAGKDIRLDVSVDPGTGSVAADPERLQQVIWNLLSNAVKFTPGGGHIGLSVIRRTDHVELIVADTGIGIAPEFLPYVFDRFRQGDSGPSRRHGGLGLGLAIVRSLVELHGGTVTAESDGANQGAVFTVRLPTVASHSASSV